MINQSITTGIFPDQLKIAKIIPLYKKDNVKLIENYHPISILSSTSKIFEKWYLISNIHILLKIIGNTP